MLLASSSMCRIGPSRGVSAVWFALLGALLAGCGGTTTTEKNDEIAAASCEAGGATGSGGSAGSGTSCAGSSANPARCSGNAAPLMSSPCPTGYFLYRDSINGPMQSTGGRPPASPSGDNLCHQECTSDADCTDPCRPRCHVLGLYQGGDFKCNGRVRVCGTATYDECPWW